MNISSLNLFKTNNYPNFKKNQNQNNIKFKKHLEQDTVCFSKRIRNNFPTKEKAFEYYKNIANKANEALDNNDEITAFETLGYDVTSDFETDEITINNDYKPYFDVFIKGLKMPNISYKTLGIDQKRLLQNVVKIKGQAEFFKDDMPDHQIETQHTKYLDPPKGASYIERKYIKYYSFYIEQIKKIKLAAEKLNIAEALKLMGYDFKTDIDGNININGDFGFCFSLVVNGIKTLFNFDEIGIDKSAILNKIKKVSGNLHYPDSATSELKEGMEVDGFVLLHNKTDEETFFANYISTKDINKAYKEVPEKIIRTYAKYGFLTPSVKTKKNFYFNSIEGKNKNFLEHLALNKNTLLTTEELQQKYGLTAEAINKGLHKKILKPYLLENLALAPSADSINYIFNTTDEKNIAGLEQLKELKTESTKKANKSYIPKSEFNAACQRNSFKIDFKNVNMHSFPLKYLEELGFGTRADLFKCCDNESNPTKMKQYILNNDSYDMTIPAMANIALNSRFKNPSIISLAELQEKFIGSKNTMMEGIMYNKLRVILKNNAQPVSLYDVCIDITDKKNLEFLKNIDDRAFQSWLERTLEAKEKYTKENQKAMEEFIKSNQQ